MSRKPVPKRRQKVAIVTTERKDAKASCDLEHPWKKSEGLLPRTIKGELPKVARQKAECPSLEGDCTERLRKWDGLKTKGAIESVERKPVR